MSVRANRRAATFDFSSLHATECLIIAQAAHEYGAAPSSWSNIAKLMARHPLISRPKNFFTASLCSSMYDHLMKEAGLERTDAANAPKAPENLALAQKHFQIRFDELMTLIQAEETKFKTVMKEIEEIKSGQWDGSLIAGAPMPLSKSPAATEGRLPEHTGPDATEPADAESSTQATEQTGTSEPPREDNEAGSTTTSRELTPDDVDEETVEERQKQEEEEAGLEEEGEHEEEEAETGSNLEAEGEGSKSDIKGDIGMEEVENLLEVDSDGEEQAEPQKSRSPNEETCSSEPLQSSKDADQQDDPSESSADEPLQAIRRSTRRKSSAASTAPPALSSRARTRRQRQIQEQESAGSESEPDVAPKRETPQLDEDFPPSSPYESASTRTRDGKRKASFAEETLRESKRVREDSELPDDDESSTISHSTRSRPNRQGARTGEQVPNKKFQSVIALVHAAISQHRNGTIFHSPIKLSDAPDYHEIVKRPMDLKTIKARVRDGAISNSLEFQRDVYLMFANAMMYNRPGSDVYTMAEDMMVDSETQIMNFKRTEGFRAQR